MTPGEMEANVGEALYRKMYKKWKRDDQLGPPKPPRFKEKDTVTHKVEYKRYYCWQISGLS